MITKIVTRGASGLLILAAMAMFASGASADRAQPKHPAKDQAASTEIEAFPPGTVALF
jgi:hypothetical protein